MVLLCTPRAASEPFVRRERERKREGKGGKSERERKRERGAVWG